MDEVACSVTVGNVLHTSQCEMVHISVVHRKHRTQARTRATQGLPCLARVSQVSTIGQKSTHSLTMQHKPTGVQVFKYMSP